MITSTPQSSQIVKKPSVSSPSAHIIKFDSEGKMSVPGLVTSTTPPHRIAIIGAAGSGKTTAGCTFPNRLWLDFDHKLPPGEPAIPMWNEQYCDSLVNRVYANVVNRRDAAKKWLRDNISLIPEDHTLLIDSWTMWMNSVMTMILADEGALSKPNKYFRWEQLIKYCVEITESIKSAKCTVIVMLHESPERDDEGNLTGKLNPVMQGSFKDQLLGHFTDAWHQVVNPYERDDNGKIIVENGQRKTRKGYYWVLANDPLFNCNVNKTLGEICQKHKITMIYPSYQELMKVYQLPV